MGVNQNRQEGKIFETLFEKQAKRSGFLVEKNGLTAKILWAGRPQLMKSQLDFLLADRSGRVGLFDCKSFDSDHFTFSDLNLKQVERAALYNEWGIPSGFVVWFRKSNRVVFFKGSQVRARGPRTRFLDSEGVHLGTFSIFDLHHVLK